MECHVKKTKDTTTGPPTVTASPGEGATYAITCGEWNARLIWCKFVCPGINVKCVQASTRVKEELITPKEFVCLAGRASLKDWKRAIRLGGVMLRKVMDAGRLDFYQHDTACSSSCRSTKHEPRGLGGPGGGAATAAAAASLWPGGGRPSGWPGNFLKGDRRYVMSGCGQHQRRDHVLRFWRGVARAGLLGEVVGAVQRELQARLTGLCRLAQTPALQMADAALLHGTVQSLGLSGQVDRMLAINTHGATTARRADVTTHGHGAADGVTSCEKLEGASWLEGAVADTNASASATGGRHGAAANTALATRLFTQPV
ncbi:unnamed protein product [Lampetra planeri]